MEAVLRLGVFAGVFVVTALLEVVLPRRPRTRPRGERWLANIGILLLDVVVQRFTVGAIAVTAAIWAQSQGIGLFNLVGLPGWLAGLFAFLVLDLAVWAQHVATHKIPLLWRLHQVHHADLDVDLTTGTRFHPVEILLSAVYKAVIVILIGADPWAVVVFESVLNAAAMLTHANLAVPVPLDRALRWVVCTPDMHRVHHSTVRLETDSNYGFFLSVWDRLFRTMRWAPARGQLGVELGLPYYRRAERLGLGPLLAMPFGRQPWAHRRAAASGGQRAA
ncbi:MAG: sterol desaturase family protein [Geminicoccaceae bacterium]